jgi:hypothetical protein
VRRLTDPSLIARTYRDPLAWFSLAVDVLPLAAILMFGWGATPLVALYWLENLVIGAATLARIVAVGFGKNGHLLGGVFLAVFFTVHYGIFCFGHGLFLMSFASDEGNAQTLGAVVDWAMVTGPHMWVFVGAIAAVNVLYFVVDFVGKGEFRSAHQVTLMFSPYGRIVALHVAIILGAALAFQGGDPLAGVLGLLLLRFVFGIGLSLVRRLRLDQPDIKVDA